MSLDKVNINFASYLFLFMAFTNFNVIRGKIHILISYLITFWTAAKAAPTSLGFRETK